MWRLRITVVLVVGSFFAACYPLTAHFLACGDQGLSPVLPSLPTILDLDPLLDEPPLDVQNYSLVPNAFLETRLAYADNALVVCEPASLWSHLIRVFQRLIPASSSVLAGT